MTNEQVDQVLDKLVEGYDTIMEKLYEWSEKTDEKAGPLLLNGLEDADTFMHELGQWTSDEIDLMKMYVRRDLHHMALNLEKNNQEFSQWLEIDKQKVEQGLFKILASMADQTRLELKHLQHLAEKNSDLHTGEVTSVGSLSCKACGKEIHFHRSGRIPPCPSCYKTEFERKYTYNKL